MSSILSNPALFYIYPIAVRYITLILFNVFRPTLTNMLIHPYLLLTSVQVYAEAFLATATSGTSGAKEAKEKATRDEIKELYHKASTLPSPVPSPSSSPSPSPHYDTTC